MIKLHLYIVILVTILLLCTAKSSFAQSSYVLPYPSFMPGSKFYQLQLLKDAVLKYWYFGSLGQFAYNLKQSDKYLVEAKTLFEYKQYLLGTQALKKSDMYFKNSPKYLSYAKKENKNVDRQQKILKEAALKHMEVLNEIKIHVPNEIIWNPEKSQPTKIFLSDVLTEAIRIRESCI